MGRETCIAFPIWIANITCPKRQKRYQESLKEKLVTTEIPYFHQTSNKCRREPSQKNQILVVPSLINSSSVDDLKFVDIIFSVC